MISDLGKSINRTIKSLIKSQITDEKVELAIKELCTHLLSSNVSTKLVFQLRDTLKKKMDLKKLAPGVDKSKVINQILFEEISNIMDPKVESITIKKEDKNVIVFVGLQGCGKTTTVCKLANFYKKKGFKVGIVCADTFRAGAFEQVKQNALKIKVPYFGDTDADPVCVAMKGVKKFKDNNFDLILVDTSGRHTQEKDLFNEMKEMVEKVKPSNVIFVMDAGVGQIAEKHAEGFKKDANFGCIILTKLDGTKKFGGALTSVAATKTPISFVGTGELMEDLEIFEAKRFVSKMLGMGDLQGLAEKFQEIELDEKELAMKFQKGTFTLKDFYNQFQQIMKLGPIGKLLEMVPGVSNLPIPDEGDFKKMICIFDSMNAKELNGDGTLFQKESKRIVRVAKGSGCSVEIVSNLLFQFKKMSSMMKNMSSLPAVKNLLSKGNQGLSLNQKDQFKKQAQKFLPKDVLDQINCLLK